mmetsp:Transcript_8637/g.18767  ORF Transcript_8637/g.18767 Transcript_8637/m.18767 type:complete len:239 (+) Transcript_8637:370-1086(+)
MRVLRRVPRRRQSEEPARARAGEPVLRPQRLSHVRPQGCAARAQGRRGRGRDGARRGSVPRQRRLPAAAVGERQGAAGALALERHAVSLVDQGDGLLAARRRRAARRRAGRGGQHAGRGAHRLLQEVRLEGRGGEPREALDGDWAEAVQGPDPKRAQPLLHAVDRQVHVGGDRVAARADGGQPQQPARAPRRRLLARRRLLVTLRLPRGGLASIEAVQSPSVRKRARSAVRLSLKRLC